MGLLTVHQISCMLINQTLYISPIDTSKTLRLQAAIIFTVTGLSFIVNVMLIYGFYKTSRPFSIVTKLFVYLSVWDVLTAIGFSINSILLYDFINKQQKNCLLLLGFFAFNRFQFYIGVNLLVIISTLRFIALRWPFTEIRKRYVNAFLITQTFTGIIIASVPIYITIEQRTFNGAFQTARYISSLLIFFVTLTLIINILSYVQFEKVCYCTGKQ